MEYISSAALTELTKDTGPFGGLSNLIANSVGLEWGWLLLVGGALAVTVMAVLPAGEVVPAVDGHRRAAVRLGIRREQDHSDQPLMRSFRPATGIAIRPKKLLLN